MNQEQQYLIKTIASIIEEKAIIQAELTEVEAGHKAHLEENGQLKIQGGSIGALMETSFSIREKEQALSIDGFLLTQKRERLSILNKMEPKPYFGRVDFHEEEEQTEKIYLGISSLKNQQLGEYQVYDWRAPIAHLYYEGKLGKSKYPSVSGEQEVIVERKRQYIIEDGKLENFADTIETIGDEVLLEVLGQKSSTRMNNIVATIQKEQNEVVRDLHTPVLVVQGVAGSGKTSAMLQRVAYLLYHFREKISMKDILLFSPNRLFSEYIANVLPSLGEAELKTKSYRDFIQQYLPGITIDSLKKDFAQVREFELSGNDQVKAIKKSRTFFEALPAYLESLATRGIQWNTIKLEEEIIFSKQDLKKIYRKINVNLPINERMRKLQQLLLQKVEEKKSLEMKAEWVEKEVELISEQVIQKIEQEQIDKTFFSMDAVQEEAAGKIVAKKYASVVKKIRRMSFWNLRKQYLHLLTRIPDFLDSNLISAAAWQRDIEMTRLSLIEKKLSLVDATICVWLRKVFLDFAPKNAYRYIFIDEIQDYTFPELALLKVLYPYAKFTLCGDLNQSLYGKRDVLQELPYLFSKEQTKKIQLTTSYRSTQEINLFSLAILGEKVENVKAYGRSGQKPILKSVANEQMMAHAIVQQIQSPKKQAGRTVIIGKTMQECQTAYELIKEQIPVKLIKNETSNPSADVLIIPAFYAKGLEFDKVIVWNASKSNYSTSEAKNTLYTICSRAMHQLTVLVIGEPSLYISRIPDNLYEKQQ